MGVRYSLRFKLSIGLILIIGMIFAGFNTFNLLTHRSTRRRDALANNETVARLVAGALLTQLANFELNSEPIKHFVSSFITVALTLNKHNEDLAFVLIVDADNRFVAGRAKPELTVFPSGIKLQDERQVLTKIAQLQGKLGLHMRTKRFPLKLAGKGVVGKLMVGTSLARLAREAQRDLVLNLIVFVATLALLMSYAAVALGRLVIRPIHDIMNAMRGVQEGDLTREVLIQRADEMGQLANTYNFMVRGLRERERLKDAFSRYVSPQVYEKFRAGEIYLDGESRDATVLFSDIRSFTSLSERLGPEAVVAMLNEYFTEMVEIVFKYNGFLNKFIGDAIMAVYNVPLTQTHPELRAVKTALEMMEALDRLNTRRLARSEFPVKIGVGINTGPVVAGNIGHEKRLEYTVIGDTVNLAQRIESQTKAAGAPVLISRATHSAIADYVEAVALPPVKVKGKQEPVALYAVQGLAPAGVSLLTAPTAPPPAPPSLADRAV